jgi:hypothetical protein
MSRSRKKPYWKMACDRDYKTIFNRVIRRNREDIGQYNEYKKHHNSWDICDYNYYHPEEPKAYRK